MDFDEVYGRFRRPVWRLARRFSDSDDEALDLSQEIFLRIWRGLPGFRGDAKLSTWVFQIAWNHLRAHRRRRGRRLGAVVEDAAVDPAAVESVRDENADPERQAAAGEMLQRVADALRALPEHYQTVVWLRDGEDLRYEEISAVLDIPIGTVRSRLARARALLRHSLDGS